MVTNEGLTQFKKLYKTEFGVELSDAEVAERANRLLNLYRAVYGQKKSNIKISKKNGKKTQRKKNNKQA
jgi:hypothetical protein